MTTMPQAEERVATGQKKKKGATKIVCLWVNWNAGVWRNRTRVRERALVRSRALACALSRARFYAQARGNPYLLDALSECGLIFGFGSFWCVDRRSLLIQILSMLRFWWLLTGFVRWSNSLHAANLELRFSCLTRDGVGVVYVHEQE